MITLREHSAAEAAVGSDLPAHDIMVALQKWSEAPLGRLKDLLEEALRLFNEQGGRGVVLADEIDMLRIAVAVREVRENG